MFSELGIVISLAGKFISGAMLASYTSRYLGQVPKEMANGQAAQLRLAPIEPFATTEMEARTSPVRTRRLSPPDLSWMKRVLWPSLNYFLREEGLVLAGYIAFTAIFAMFPFIILLLSLAGVLGFDDAAAEAIEGGLELLPPEVASVLRPVTIELRGAPHGTILTFSVLLTLWFSSSGLESLRHTLNMAFRVTDPPAFWSNRLSSMVITVVAAGLFLIAMTVLIGLPIAGDVAAWMASQDPLDRNLHTGARYLSAGGILLMVTLALFLILPNRQMALSDVWPGAVVVVCAWLGTTALYSVYLRGFGRYSILYGSLGGVIITLFFFYISAIIFIFGAQINAAMMRGREQRRSRRKL